MAAIISLDLNCLIMWIITDIILLKIGVEWGKKYKKTNQVNKDIFL